MSVAMWLAWGAMAGFAGMYGWGWKKAGERGRRWLEWGLAVLVAGVSASSMLTHEPWMDELHTWLQARDLSAGELWKEMACAGHFVPWHLVLHPFARGGAPVAAMGWVAWGINAATVAWFARKAPLGGWAKAAVALSCVFLYVNPVIPRCYVLVPPVLFGLAALWGKRDERPVAFGILVALLANTHLYMEGTAVALSGVFAWENVLRRKDGKRWRACGWQWGGLGMMAAGGAVALAQVLPSLWQSSVRPGSYVGWQTALGYFGMGCNGWLGGCAVVAGLVGLGVAAWRRDKGVFWTMAASVAFMAGFSVFLYPAHVVNRALLWWPVVLGGAWALGERGRVALAVAAMGVGLMRPDMTVADWRKEYDPLPGACRFIAGRYGRNVEVWIEGNDLFSEGAIVYLDNVMDWRTGRRAGRIQLAAGRRNALVPFGAAREAIFGAYPEKTNVLVLGTAGERSGLTPWCAEEWGARVVYLSQGALWMPSSQIVILEVPRGGGMERNTSCPEEEER